MTLPYNFGSATNADRNFFKQLQEDLESLGGGVSLVNQDLIDATDDGGTIYVNENAVIEEITITSKRIHFIFNDGANEIDMLGTVTFESSSYCTWQGNNTFFNWLGNNTDPMFKLSRSQFLHFSQMRITSSPSDPLDSAFWLMSTTTGQIITQCIFEDIFVEGTAAGGLQYGWRIGVEGDNDGVNNDFHRFIRTTVANYDICAYSIEQTQAKFITFYNSGFSANGIGQYGVSTALGGGFGGSFIFENGGGGGNTVVDFYLGQPDDIIVIQGCQLENSNRVLDTLGNSSNAWPVHIRDCRISTSNLDADNRVIKYTQRGPLYLTNCSIEADVGVPLEIYLDATGHMNGVAVSCSIQSSLGNPFNSSNDANGQWLTYGCQVTDPNGGTPIPFPMIIPVLDFDELPPDMPGPGGLIHLSGSNTTVIGAVITASGANDVLAWWNGSDWKVVAS